MESLSEFLKYVQNRRYGIKTNWNPSKSHKNPRKIGKMPSNWGGVPSRADQNWQNATEMGFAPFNPHPKIPKSRQQCSSKGPNKLA
jgi:hypothetical protein